MVQAKKAVAFAGSVLLLAVLAGCSGHPATPEAAAEAHRGAIMSTLSANISGPCAVSPGGSGTWYANASGGTGSYTYKWQHRAESSTTWSVVIGTESSYTRKVGTSASSFYLRVTVTSGGVSVYDDHYVYVGTSDCELLS